MTVRLEPAALQSRVKHSTTEPLRSSRVKHSTTEPLCSTLGYLSGSVYVMIVKEENHSKLCTLIKMPEPLHSTLIVTKK